MAAAEDPGVPNGLFEVLSPPLSIPLGPPSDIGTFAQTVDSTRAAETSSDVPDHGVAGVKLPAALSPTIPFPVVVLNAGTSSSDTLGEASGAASDAVFSPAASESWVASSQVTLQENSPGPLIASAPVLGFAGGVTRTGGEVGFPSVESGMLAGSIAIPVPANLSSQLIFEIARTYDG